MQQKNIALLTVLFVSGCVPISAMYVVQTSAGFKKNAYKNETTYEKVTQNNEYAKGHFKIIKTGYLNQPFSIETTTEIPPGGHHLTVVTNITRHNNIFLINEKMYVNHNKKNTRSFLSWISKKPDSKGNFHKGFMLPKNEWVSKHFKDTYAFSFVNPDSMKNTPKEMKDAKK